MHNPATLVGDREDGTLWAGQMVISCVASVTAGQETLCRNGLVEVRIDRTCTIPETPSAGKAGLKGAATSRALKRIPSICKDRFCQRRLKGKESRRP